MAKKLKAVIFGITDVIAHEGTVFRDQYNEIGRLIKYLLSVGIRPIFYGNHDWDRIEENGRRYRLCDRIKADWGDFPWFIAQTDGVPWKGSTEASQYILHQFDLDTAEVVYVGNSERDMYTAVNGDLLFLNATWFAKNNEYGFFFNSPLDIARFISTFCLRDSLWHYVIEEPQLRFYALAPYSTYYSEYEYLSTDAKNAAKFGQGHPDFWTKYLLSTIYFSELVKEIDYIAVVPGHRQGSGSSIMAEPMTIFAKCFRKRFLGDLIVRHTTIDPSHTYWKTGILLDHSRQLCSINLTKYPHKTATELYKNCPIKRGKRVLIIDDICTNGYSLEAARVFVEQTGAEVVNMAWLKTITKDYQFLQDRLSFDPFVPQNICSVSSVRALPYRRYISDSDAPEEVTGKLRAYDNWRWPDNI